MGFLLQSQGKLAEAEPYHREALIGYSKRHGPAGLETAACEHVLGKVLLGLSRHADAETHLLSAESILRTAQGLPTDHRYSRCVSSTIRLYEKWHAAEPGKGYDAKAAEWRAKLAEWQASTQPSSSQPK